jgi:hypothetical protein
MFLVRESGNAKIGLTAATYAPIAQTCPASCPLRNGNGCYAEVGNVGLHMRRLQADLAGLNGDTIAMLEASEIEHHARTIPRGRPLRIHVSGDATTPFRASTLAQAARHWPGPVWTYTHAWRDVPRAAWGSVSVLASCETTAKVKEAQALGYATALVTRPHTGAKAYTTGDGVKVVPCPSQTRGIKCDDCRLCFRDMKGATIGFEVHGASKKRALSVIQA